MIVDRLENWSAYFSGKDWKTIFDFLSGLKPDAEEKKYVLEGDDIYAVVFSYNTKTADEAKMEAHRKYIDIQMPLSGAEGMEWVPTADLEPKTEYDAAKDVILFHHPKPGQARVDLYPGTFALLYPQDAHMPSLMIGEKPSPIKKVVVKVNVARVKR